MKRHRLAFLAILIVVTIIAASISQQTDAIPAFARRYQFSCSTCHGPFPRLKPYGEEFAGRGFRLEDPSKEPSRATYDVGDSTLKLFRDIPIAMRVEGYASWKEDATAKSDAEWPWVFKILTGGPISNKASYYVYFLTEKGEVVGLEDAWLQFNSIFGAPIDLQVGQFQVCDPLFKRELRLERYDYQIFKTHVGEADVDLTYDRGLITIWHAPAGIDAVLQVVNGNGIDTADEFDNFDTDRHKNFALRVVKPFKGVRLGLFAYSGKQEKEGRINKTTYFGPDLVIDFGDKFQFSAEYLERRDDNPYFQITKPGTTKTRGGFGELHFFPKGPDGKLTLSALYNKIDSDDELARYESASLTVNYLIARNLRLVAEGGREIHTKQSRFSLGLVTAF